DTELEQEGLELDRRRRCLPPVSPYRCRRQAVLDLLFDDVWRQLVGWMGELVQRHWEGCVSDAEKNLSPGGRQDTQGSFMLPAALPATLLPRLDQTRVPQLTASLQQSQVSLGHTTTHHTTTHHTAPHHTTPHHTTPQHNTPHRTTPPTQRNANATPTPPQPPPTPHHTTQHGAGNPKSRDLKHKSRRKSKKQKQPSTAAKVPVGATATHQNLNNLIMIHGIPLQQRNMAVLEKPPSRTRV
ncbi:hypothetical protein CRUP_014842, partial [Coryphaenoides rupestris]